MAKGYDKRAKAAMQKWPNRTKMWGVSGREGARYWIRGWPEPANQVQAIKKPYLCAPGAEGQNPTRPDGLWMYFGCTKIGGSGEDESVEAGYNYWCDITVVEACQVRENFYDKRSRYVPPSHGLVLVCPVKWLLDTVTLQKGGSNPRWRACGSFEKEPKHNLTIPVRRLRVLYVISEELVTSLREFGAPAGHEFFCSIEALERYNDQKVQRLLKRMSVDSQFIEPRLREK